MVERYQKQDPLKEREESKYEYPVPSRVLILQYLEEIGRPVSYAHLLGALGVEGEAEKEGFRRRLIAMERDGQLIRNRRGSYALVQQMDLIPGRVLGHRDGFGFLIPDDHSGDIFLPAREMSTVFTDDRVLVRVLGADYKGRREGTIVEVLERNTQYVVGRYYEEDSLAYVDPDNRLITQDIIVPIDQRGNAKHGQFVVVEVITQPRLRRQPTGKIAEILGDQLTPGMEVELAIRSHNIPFVWPDEVKTEVSTLPRQVHIDSAENRIDLRHLYFLTIDGEEAKDFDDAVYCERVKSGWHLTVAIADVGHYVKPNTALDAEAKRRGNSVYFPNKVIPMLPELLSNELCSLKPRQDRLVIFCHMQLDAQGKLLQYHFDQGVIYSQARLTYTEVFEILEGKKKAENKKIGQVLKELHQIYKKLLRQRHLRGAIEFDSIDTRILFSSAGKIKKIVQVQRNDAHKLIEEAMLLANVSAADFILRYEIASLYRIHAGPERQKLVALRDFLKAFGLRLSGGEQPTAMDYAKLLHRIENRKETHLLQTVLLRSLRQAVYSPDNIGHFGLAYPAYTHFTSPIRRYPDLIIHRAIKHILLEKPTEDFLYEPKAIKELGMHCSLTERRADLATRNAVDWLKCDYMQHKVGQTFDGIINDVTGFGVFVELNDIYVQGLLHVTSLRNDYYQYDATHHLLRGRRGGQIYRLGDPIRVLVARVDINERTIDFELA